MHWFRQFMSGRRGADLLTFVLLIVAIILSRVAFYTRSVIVYVIFVVVLFFCIFRFFSRNIQRREAENQVLLRAISPIRRWFSHHRQRSQEKQFYCFFKCPKCKERLRVPKGKGKISITCPKCGTEFIKKT